MLELTVAKKTKNDGGSGSASAGGFASGAPIANGSADKTMAMTSVDRDTTGKRARAEKPAKPAKPATPKAEKPAKVKVPKEAKPAMPATDALGSTGEPGATPKPPKVGGGANRSQLWRIGGFASLFLAAVLLIWAGLDLSHGWAPDGAKGILLRLLPIVCFLVAAAAAITKASATLAVPTAAMPDVTSIIAAERGAAAERGPEAVPAADRSATSSILGTGYAPAAPLAASAASPKAPSTSVSLSVPAYAAQAPVSGGYADAPVLQPGVATPDFVSAPSSSGYSAGPGSFDTPSFDHGVDRSAGSHGPGAQLANMVGAPQDARGRHPIGVADQSVVEIYRNWVLTQTTGERAFQALDVNDRYDEWFLLSASGVATLLAWTHEDHGATYSAETWVDQILPMQGIGVADRQLALDLLNAAALHAGGLHTAPTQRLMAYQPSELVTAMATVHVGLLRLYSGLEGTDPSKVLREQLGDPISTQPSLPPPPPSDPQARWLPPGS
jgi:hypothetical protein